MLTKEPQPLNKTPNQKVDIHNSLPEVKMNEYIHTEYIRFEDRYCFPSPSKFSLFYFYPHPPFTLLYAPPFPLVRDQATNKQTKTPKKKKKPGTDTDNDMVITRGKSH